METLSLRYRALDALVKGLFPTDNTQDISVLFQLAAARNIAMPLMDDFTPATDLFDDCKPRAYQSPQHSARIEVASPDSSASNPFTDQAQSNPIEEKLIPTPHGISHYVGPSSSFRFAATVRKMVARCSAASDGRGPRKQHSAVRADFASMRTSKALEPRLHGSVNGASDEESIDSSPEDEILEDTKSNKRPRLRHNSSLKGEVFVKKRKRDSMAEFLPQRAISDALIRAFFDNVHFNYALFHRSMFQLRYEATWERNVHSLFQVEPGWSCCLAMIFVFGAQVLEQYDSDQAVTIQRCYLGFVRSSFRRLISTTSLVNIQALLLLQLYEHNAGERNNAWMLLGCASRMAMSLGMHRDGTSLEFDPIERNVRRRVWWTIYTFEKNLCVILGRPSAIDDNEVCANLPDETMLDSSDCPPDYSDHSLRLTKISSRIKRLIYAVPSASGNYEETPTITTAKELLKELDCWHCALPQHLRPEWNSMLQKQRRAVLLLHVYYHHSRSLVCRPFLIKKVDQDISRLEQKSQPSTDLVGYVYSLSQDCATAAHSAIEYLHKLAVLGLLDGTGWLDVYYIYHGVLILCLDFLARPRDQVDSPDDLARKAAVRTILNATRSLKLAPTYRILAQVAAQFAGIVGIAEDIAASEQATTEHIVHISPVSREQLSHIVPDSRAQVDVSNIVSDWFQHDASSMSWDFFDIGAHMGVHSASLDEISVPYAGTFAEADLALNEVDDWAARALSGMNNGHTS